MGVSWILACERCAFYRTDQTHGALQVVLVLFAIAAVSGAGVLAVKGARHHGIARNGRLALALSLVLLPLSVLPLVTENVVHVADFTVFCDKPVYEDEALPRPNRDLPPDVVVAGQPKIDACRSAATASRRTTTDVLLIAGAVAVLGLALMVVGKSRTPLQRFPGQPSPVGSL